MAIVRDYSFRMLLSAEEHSRLKAEAERAGLTMTDLIRQIVRKFDLPSKETGTNDG